MMRQAPFKLMALRFKYYKAEMAVKGSLINAT